MTHNTTATDESPTCKVVDHCCHLRILILQLSTEHECLRLLNNLIIFINLSHADQELCAMCYTKEHLNVLLKTLVDTWSGLNVKDVCCTYCSTNIFTEYVSENIIALQKIKLILLVEPRICVDID